MQNNYTPLKNIIPLSTIKDQAKQRQLLEYLDSALSQYTNSQGGVNYYDENGDYIDESTLSINLGENSGTLYIRFVAHDDDRLIKVEYESPDSEAVEKLANTLIIESLTNALGAKKTTFFRRVFFCYIGEQLDGEYWLSSNIRVAPVDPEDPNPQLSSLERYISIDMNVDAIDVHDAIAIANNRANILAARLSLILNIGIYPPSSEHRWTFASGTNLKCELRQLGYYKEGTHLSEMPRKGKHCKAGAFEHTMMFRYKHLGELTKFPTETRRLLRAIGKADNRIVTAFDNCALLYQLALNAGKHIPTVRISYLVAAIEALSKSESAFKGPSDFIRHYASPTHDIKHLLDFMHQSVRSAHFHAGEFSFGEFEQPRHLSIYRGSSKRMSEHRLLECIKLIRTALYNWSAIKINDSEDHQARQPNTELMSDHSNSSKGD